MTSLTRHIKSDLARHVLILDMSDCYTWSFPEFNPFCSHLYDFSCYKRFKAAA